MNAADTQNCRSSNGLRSFSSVATVDRAFVPPAKAMAEPSSEWCHIDMTSLFDVIARDDDAQRVAGRKAIALAHKRIGEQFDQFLAHRTSSDYTTRLELIKDDFRKVVESACVDAGYADADGLVRTLWNERLVHASPRTASTAETDGFDKEARRPKLCPYHSEVVDASLASGKADAGYAAMAQHAWGEKHCQGDGYEGGRCSFKPEMTTKTYWDEKKEQAEERKREREEARQQAENSPVAEEPSAVSELEEAVAEEPVAETPEVSAEEVADTSDNVVEVDFGGEAEGPGLTEQELMSVAASFQRFAPLSEYDKYFGGKPGAAAKAKAAMIEEYGEERGEQVFYAKINKKRKENGETKSAAPIAPGPAQQIQPPQPFQNVPVPQPPLPNAPVTNIPTTNLNNEVGNGTTQVPPQDVNINLPQPPVTAPPTVPPNMRNRPVAAVHEAEALKRVSPTQGEGPVPKMDKRRWTPQNVKRIDSEMPGSPHPTKRIDPAPGLYEEKVTDKKELEDIGEDVTEKQDVTQKADFQGGKANQRTWPGGSPSAIS